jgi:hypothetical protein
MALLLDCLDSLTWEDSAPQKWRTWARVREVNCFVEIFERVQTKSFVVTRCILSKRWHASSPSNDLFLALWKSQQIYCITGRPNLRIRLFNLPCWNESRGIGGFKVSDAILNLLFSPLCLHRQIYLYCYIEGIPLCLHPLHLLLCFVMASETLNPPIVFFI